MNKILETKDKILKQDKISTKSQMKMILILPLALRWRDKFQLKIKILGLTNHSLFRNLNKENLLFIINQIKKAFCPMQAAKRFLTILESLQKC